MAESVTVLVPVLGRPWRVEPTIESVARSEQDIKLSLRFLVSLGDTAELAAVRDAGADHEIVPWAPGPGDWARKLNRAFRKLDTDWALLGADDLNFHSGWADRAIERAGDTCVIGTSDLGNQRVRAGRHSTHPLVHRDYLACGTVDEDDKILHEGYSHQFTDDEFCQTAMFRRVWAFAPLAVVEHLHPDWGKADDDATYRRGRELIWHDMDLYNSRKWMWAL